MIEHLPRVPVGEVDDPVGLLRAAGIMLPEEAERRAALLDARWVLVRIDGSGERWRCGRCNCRHTHFTLMCVPRPFRGLRGGLLAYWRHTAVPDADLAPEQKLTRDAIASSLGFRADLGTSHPETARAAADDERSLDLGAWVLGAVEPISDDEARRFAAQINVRAHRVLIRV